MFTTTISVGPSGLEHFTIPLTCSSGFGRIRRNKRTGSNPADPAHWFADYINNGSNVEPFAVNSYVRLAAAQVRLTSISRKEDLAGTVRFYPVANHHAFGQPTHGLTTPPVSLPGTVTGSAAHNETVMIHAPTHFRVDEHTHKMNVAPCLHWHSAAEAYKYIGIDSAPLPANDCWNMALSAAGSENPYDADDLAGSPFAYFQIYNTVSAVQIFELEVCAVVEVWHNSVSNAMQAQPIVPGIESHMDAMVHALATPKANHAHFVDKVGQGASRVANAAQHIGEATMKLFGVYKLGKSIFNEVRGAARIAGPIVEEAAPLLLAM